MHNQPKPHHGRVLIFLLVWFGALGALYVNQQRITDWWKLRGYFPSSAVAAIARSTQMNDHGTHLFYVNKPQLLESSTFSKECPIAAEKTIILGCYKGGDRGIYLYDVTDIRLQGVEEVTAAHEMLHAAYARLSAAEKKQLDTSLEAFYQKSLNDERVRETIALYRQTEPTEIANEMHSIFATEVMDLPAELEAHYKQYFTNRKAVVTMALRYQAEFTLRRDQVAAFDADLNTLKSTIDTNQSRLLAQRSELDAQQRELDVLRRTNVGTYNATVASFNQLVRAYNALLSETQGLIAEYNDTVEKRNALALEERQLTQALSAEGLPSAQ
ncbi:hypothetical protein IPL68_07670 [Candidatus Saccharibacteria bacterium]|nr:MAG: hypothetical protein IPL68_07670 [Candidatus Saccharibacteria bacterium]